MPGKKRLAPVQMVRIFLLAVFIVVGKSGCSQHDIPDSRPNIILIMTDDQDVDSLQYLPNIQSNIIQTGITFTNGFVASPVCIPSRASILRGQYVHHHNITGKSQEFHDRGLEQETIATILQNAGYRTGLVGKYFNGNLKPQKPPAGWDEWNSILTDNAYYDYKLNENGRSVFYGKSADDYISKVLAEKSDTFIKQNSEDKPFFLYINTVAPHTPVIPAPQYASKFLDVSFQFHFEADLSDKPVWVRNYYAENKEKRIQYFDFDIASTEKAADWHRNRLRTLLSVDDMIGKLIQTLKEKGEYENTYIFFLSDNGDGITKHIQTSAKLTPYEEGIRIPFLAFGPGVPAGRKLPYLVSTVDLLPTFAEIAGAEIPDFADGRSLMPLLSQNPLPEAQWRNSVVVELGPVSSNWPWKSTPPMYRLLRTRTDKYVEYITDEREYYDLLLDPDEMKNIYDDLTPNMKHNLAEKMDKAAPWKEWNADAKKSGGDDTQ